MRDIAELRRILRANRGKIFTVRFVKKNGEVRELNGRLGVHSSGKPSSTAHISKYVTVYDMRKKDFRNVNLETISYIASGGVKMEA